MDIEEIKKNWNQINNELEKQRKFNAKMFSEIIKDKAKNSLNKILNYEISGAIVLFLMMLFVIFRFEMLDTSLTLAGGIISVIIIVLALILSGILIKKINRVKFYENTLAETIKDVSNLKIYYYKYKIASWINSIILALSFIPAFAKIVHGDNVFDHISHYIIPLSIGLPIGIIILYFIFKRFYEFNLTKVENLLKDIEE